MSRLFRSGVSALAVGAMLALTPLPTRSADATIKVGFIGTMSGPAGSIGQDMLRAFQLGLDEHGGKMGGLTVDLVTGDDQAKSERGVEVANQLLQKDNVDIFTGLSFTNVVDSIMGPVTKAGKIIVAPLGGSSLTAGARCNSNFFMVSWNTDTLFEALGESFKKQNIKKVAFIAQNFQAGLDAIAGFKRGFGGSLVAEILTPFEQSEFSAEVSQIRTAAPQALVYFMPGGSGIAFNRQFHQAGMAKQVPLYGATIQADTLTFSALGPAADGIHVVGNWSPDLTVPASQKFVAAFKAKYGTVPSIQAAMSYDSFSLLDAALSKVKGDFKNTDKLRAAIKTAKFASVRGPLAFSSNHFPIQNIYLGVVADGPDGKPATHLESTLATNRADSHVKDCTLK